MDDNNNSQIVKRIQAGDSATFAELVEKYQRAIHGYIYHKTQDESAAEDAWDLNRVSCPRLSVHRCGSGKQGSSRRPFLPEMR